MAARSAPLAILRDAQAAPFAPQDEAQTHRWREAPQREAHCTRQRRGPLLGSARGERRDVAGFAAAVADADRGRARALVGHRPAADSGRALSDAAPVQSRHRRAQHPAEAAHPAVQAGEAPGADRPADLRPGGAARDRGVRRRQQGVARSRAAARPSLRQGDRAVVLGLCVFRHRHAARTPHLDLHLSGAARLHGRGRDADGRSGCRRHLRDQSPLQHGLRAGHLHGVDLVGAQLCGRRVGAGVAPAEPDPLDGRLFRAPGFARAALSQGAVALCPSRGRGRADPGDVPGRRADARRQAAPAQARPAELHGVVVRSEGTARRGVRAGRHQLRPGDRGSRAGRRARDPGRREAALQVQPEGAVRLSGAQCRAAPARQALSLRLCLRQLRPAGVAAPVRDRARHRFPHARREPPLRRDRAARTDADAQGRRGGTGAPGVAGGDGHAGGPQAARRRWS